MKQKDSDIQTLHERVQILEKLVEINQNLTGLGVQGQPQRGPPTGQNFIQTDTLNDVKGFGENYIPQETYNF